MRSRPTRCRWHFVQVVLLIQRPVRKPDIAGVPVSDLVPLAQMSNQPLFQVIPYPTQRLAAIAVVKVADPAFKHGVDFIHDPFKGHDRPISFGEFGDPVFDFLLGFLRGLNMGIKLPGFPASAHADREPKKVKALCTGINNLCLGPVQSKLQSLQNSPQHAHGLTGSTLPAEDDKSSSPRELPPRALTEPDVNVSAHPAPIVQPMHTTISNEQTKLAVFVQYNSTTVLLVSGDSVGVCISASPT